jgi:thiopurine S-methyltransferase
MIGAVDAIYDRAALVALPADMRRRYGAHLHEITQAALQLLICFEYDQGLMTGPPFSIDSVEVARVYDGLYKARPIASGAVKGLLKGICPAQETVWLLR